MPGSTLIIIPEEELKLLKATLQEIFQVVKNLQAGQTDIPLKNITANEFMNAVRIRRTKFDELVKLRKIRIKETIYPCRQD